MLYASIALFALAAIFGIIILKNWLTSSDTSRSVVYTHGFFAALGLVILIIVALQSKDVKYTTSLILFVVAALAGFYMFFRDLKGKFSPTALAIIHGLVAVAGFIFLILTIV